MKNERSLAERAYEQIEEWIVTLQLKPGTVFSEAELSEQLKIGRTPVREALQKLSAQNLVTTLPRRGMMVTEINIAHHLELLETRRVLERLIATLAARRANSDQKKQLKQYAQQIEQAAAAGDLTEFMRADHAFDTLVEEASGNLFAVNANAPFHAHCRRFWYYYQSNGDLNKIAQLHGQMMQAIASANESDAAGASDALMDYLVEFTHSALRR